MENDKSTSVEQDISSAINMGRKTANTARNISRAANNLRTAKTAATAAKVAGHTATGNVVGAVMALLKDEKVRKTAVIVILLPAILLTSVLVICMYALPTAIYETVSSFFSEIAEQWEEDYYGSTSSPVVAFLLASTRLERTWDALRSFVADIFETGSEEIDGTGRKEDEMEAATSKAANQKSLQNKIELCIKKVSAREDNIESAINNAKDSLEQEILDRYKADSVNLTINVTKEDLTQESAITLMALYTVQAGGSLDNVRKSDLAKWLGWNGLSPGKAYFQINGVNIAVPRWQGTFLPQYLYEQSKEEIKLYGEEKTDFDKHRAAVVDIIPVVEYTSTEKSRIVKTLLGDSITVDATIDVTIHPRSVTGISHLAGLWDGALPSGAETAEEAAA